MPIRKLKTHLALTCEILEGVQIQIFDLGDKGGGGDGATEEFAVGVEVFFVNGHLLFGGDWSPIDGGEEWQGLDGVNLVSDGDVQDGFGCPSEPGAASFEGGSYVLHGDFVEVEDVIVGKGWR